MVHIGKLIEEELHRQERTVTWFAKKLYCERTNVYNIFKRQSIDTELLLRISVILNRDFFMYYQKEIEETASTLLPSAVEERGCENVQIVKEREAVSKLTTDYSD